jgi:hypothetical protein
MHEHTEDRHVEAIPMVSKIDDARRIPLTGHLFQMTYDSSYSRDRLLLGHSHDNNLMDNGDVSGVILSRHDTVSSLETGLGNVHPPLTPGRFSKTFQFVTSSTSLCTSHSPLEPRFSTTVIWLRAKKWCQ